MIVCRQAAHQIDHSLWCAYQRQLHDGTDAAERLFVRLVDH